MSELVVPGEYNGDTTETHTQNIPHYLHRATARLQFPPSYIIVGVYRLFTDKSLGVPAWNKCKHGAVRGASVALGWALATFKIQRKFVQWFLMKSPSVTGLSQETVFGIEMPFDLRTYATLVFLSTQATFILTWFLSRNIRIARDRVYEQTIVSRGKGPDFWRPYVEEWDVPPVPRRFLLRSFVTTSVGRVLFKLILAPLHLIPAVGIVVSAALRSLGTAHYLHQPYYKAKNMTKEQIAVFVEEHKWDYRAFGFVASLLEGLPIVGFVFSVSNRIGAAMWAHDLEKRQHYIAEMKKQKQN